MPYFKYGEYLTSSEDFLGLLRTEITFAQYPFDPAKGETPVNNTWVVHDSTEVGGKVSVLVLKGTNTIGALSKDFHVRLTNNSFAAPTKHSSLTVEVLDGFNAGSWSLRGYPVMFEWAQENFTPTDRNRTKPIYSYIHIANGRLAMVMVGDPAVNFNDYRKSFLYVGGTKPFKFNETDVNGNILLTAGSFTAEPTITSIRTAGTHYFGEHMSRGNNSFQMLRTKSGIEFQSHFPAFITQAPPPNRAFTHATLGSTGVTLEPQGFQASKWTGKYHMSPIYVTHPYEGYRGMLENVVAVTRHNILHLDELIVDVEGKPWQQEVYRFFDCNTEQNFMNFSANLNMGLAILKEIRYAV